MAIDDDTITVSPIPEPTPRVPLEFSGLNRIPILLLGPLLHRAHEAFVPLVGGDRIGRRPVDFHVERAPADGRRGRGAAARHHRPHVRTAARHPHHAPVPVRRRHRDGAASAVLAEGRTVIHNAATEPEVVELALFLQRMGAHIALRPDRRFVIEGVESLTAPRPASQGDRLEAFSYLVAGLMTGGQVRVGGCHQDRLVTAINTLHRMGAALRRSPTTGSRASAVRCDRRRCRPTPTPGS